MQAMAADTMRSSKHLVEDIVGVLPVLLYQVRSGGPSRPANNSTHNIDLVITWLQAAVHATA